LEVSKGRGVSKAKAFKGKYESKLKSRGMRVSNKK